MKNAESGTRLGYLSCTFLSLLQALYSTFCNFNSPLATNEVKFYIFFLLQSRNTPILLLVYPSKWLDTCKNNHSNSGSLMEKPTSRIMLFISYSFVSLNVIEPMMSWGWGSFKYTNIWWFIVNKVGYHFVSLLRFSRVACPLQLCFSIMIKTE